MKVREIPVYLTDEDALRCRISEGPNCEEGYMGLPWRHVDLGDVIDAIVKHARDDHGVDIEDAPQPDPKEA